MAGSAPIPARLAGYGERWDGDDCVLWCEGVVTQATVYGENLELTRRIEVTAGTNEISIRDRSRQPRLLPDAAHVPATTSTSVIRSSPKDRATLHRLPMSCGPRMQATPIGARACGYRTMAAPRENFPEQVWQHEVGVNDHGEAPVAIVNDALGIGFEVVSRKDQFPCMLQWQNLQAGLYVLGLEPSTNHVLGHAAARERDELIWLEHGEERRYDVRFRVLAGAQEITAAEARIKGIAEQPADDYPAPSNNHVPLPGRGRKAAV